MPTEDLAQLLEALVVLSGKFSATLSFFSDFELLEQLSVHRATFKFMCLNSYSHAPITSEAIKKCIIQLASRLYLPNLLAFTIRY